MAFKFLILISILVLFHRSNAAKKYSIDRNKITVSGISSGAAMAQQMHIAYSSLINGVGIVAGPPYYCSNGLMSTATTVCMSSLFGINVNVLVNKINTYASSNYIDSPSNLKNHNVYIFSGTKDTVVNQNVVKKNEELLSKYIDSSRIKTEYNIPAYHGMVTNFFGGSCSLASTNYINNCDYNQAYNILNTVYPDDNILENAKNAPLTGTFIEFDQTEFFSSALSTKISMDSTGYIYVPDSCTADNSNCKLHVAFHGCSQGKYKIGLDYIKNSGYNQVADINNIIVLYPQAKNNLISNPFGCWDWWGYSSSDFATKYGLQMVVIKSMIDKLTF